MERENSNILNIERNKRILKEKHIREKALVKFGLDQFIVKKIDEQGMVWLRGVDSPISPEDIRETLGSFKSHGEV